MAFCRIDSNLATGPPQPSSVTWAIFGKYCWAKVSRSLWKACPYFSNMNAPVTERRSYITVAVISLMGIKFIVDDKTLQMCPRPCGCWTEVASVPGNLEIVMAAYILVSPESLFKYIVLSSIVPSNILKPNFLKYSASLSFGSLWGFLGAKNGQAS